LVGVLKELVWISYSLSKSKRQYPSGQNRRGTEILIEFEITYILKVTRKKKNRVCRLSVESFTIMTIETGKESALII